jgi:hypothetical protein
MFRAICCGLLGISALLVIRYGYLAATATRGIKKGRARLIAGLAFCFPLIALPALVMIYEATLPVYEFQGTIVSVNVKRSGSKYYSAYLNVAIAANGSINVHVSDADEHWRTGQRLKFRYYGTTGELIKATFIDENGREASEVYGSSPAVEIFTVGYGVLFAFFVLWQYKHDPEGRIEQAREPSDLYDSVDQKSLLHLSETSKE